MEQALYHVALEGRTVGPFDRRTIIGMRIKNTLDGQHVLIGANGARLTVADLIRKPAPFNPERSGSFSLVQATFTAGLGEVRGQGIDIPRFRGEVEARVQTDVLRLAGQFREAFRWKSGRVKIPLNEIVHARIRSSLVDLWLRAGDDHLQRVTLELFSPEAAIDFVEWLPNATPYGGKETAPVPLGGPAAMPHGLIVAVVGIVLTVGLVLAALLMSRH